MRRLLVLSCCIVMVLGIARLAHANESAIGERFSAPGTFDGFRGYQDIRSDLPIAIDVTYAHPVQVDTGMLEDADFLGIGTYKGDDVGGCAEDNDAKWSIYTDGIIDGIYFCTTEAMDKFGIGDKPTFEIIYDFCPSTLDDRWLMFFDEVLWACYGGGSSVARNANAGLETCCDGPPAVDRNIDVKYRDMEVSRSSQAHWIAMAPSQGLLDCCYEYDFINNRAFNVYLPPLQ